MMPTNQGSIRLLRVAGIDLFLHWSWFLVALYEIQWRAGRYTSPVWNVAEYLALFFIVLLHELGHSLACRQVGGKADRIVLWPLGGVAYVQPPERPGAVLWSIAAGPLVNVILIPVLLLLRRLMEVSGTVPVAPHAYVLVRTIFFINLALLIFNLMPVYPLDGGQILRSLLWFVFGRAWSLMIAAVIGLVGVAGLVLLALWQQSLWLGIIAVFILMNCWNGLRHALRLVQTARAVKREGWQCPACGSAPPAGAFWTCARCGRPLDIFESQGVCPHCQAGPLTMRCLNCGAPGPISAWNVSSVPSADPEQAPPDSPA